MPSNTKLLQEIRDNFTYAYKAWEDIRKEAQTDMRYVSGDPWDPAERKKREDPNSKRPCLTFDELTQYVNQLINQVRQNPIAVKVSPKGEGATDKTAEMRQGIIRGIEYKSKAQAAYINAFENAAQRSYGYFAITTGYVSEKGFDQEIRVRHIPNADSVVIDPDYKEADTSDKKFAYIIDFVPRKHYESRYPGATVTTFTQEMQSEYPDWIKSDSIQVAEYWKLKTKTRTLLLLDENGTTAYLDEYEGAKLGNNEVVMSDGKRFPILNYRKCEENSVCQYITNGVEILEENDWSGKWIPIVPVFGKVMYVNEGAGAKKKIISLVRMARDPFMTYCWLRSNQAEEGGMTPKTPFIAAEGQLEGHEDEWQKVTKEPLAFLLYKPIVDTSSGQSVPLPAPQRQPFTPNFVAYEAICESVKRAIQASMGISPLPTAAQRQNEKSGIALQRIQTQESIGSFHFIDNYKRSLEFAGRIYDDLIDKIYDTPREVGIRTPTESHESLKINSPHPETGEVEYDTSKGEHEITISTGPSYDSQREEVADFANTLANTSLFPMIADLVIRLRNLGPLGDEMADRVTPPQFAKDGNPQGKLQEASQKLQLQTQLIAELQQELEKLRLEQKGKVVEMQARKEMQVMDMELERWKLDNARAIAEIQTKAQSASERAQMYQEVWKEIHGASHEIGMQKDQQAHEMQMAQTEHEQALEQQEQAGNQQVQIAEQQAENQPQAAQQ